MNELNTKYVVTRNENGGILKHHGIDGQKWGQRNGPPYPLDYDDHSAKEKKNNPKSEIDNYDSSKPYKNNTTFTASNQKEIDEIWKHSKNEDIELPKESKFYRFGDKGEVFGSKNRTDIYVSPSLADNKDYKDLYSFDEELDRVNYTYSSKNRVKIASEDTIAKTILEICNNDKNAAKIQQNILNGKRFFQSPKRLTNIMSMTATDLDKMSSSERDKVVNTIIKNTTGNIKFGASSKNMSVRLDIESALKKKGYSGMIDSIDIKTTGKGVDQYSSNAPMVLFDSSNFILDRVE